MVFVYILYSKNKDSFYVGQTNNIDRRFREHNAGKVRSTKANKPWTLKMTLEKNTRSEAILLEKKLKNLSKLRLKKFIIKYSKS